MCLRLLSRLDPARLGAVLLGAVLLAASATGAMAQAAAGAPPDKSAYTLFNPTPDAQMRSFSTDRPNKGTSPYTVPAGHFQYETDLVGGVHDGYTGGVRFNQLFATAPVLKVGVTTFADVEVSLGGYQAYFLSGHAARQPRRFDGFGDVVVRAKFNLVGNDGGPVAAAVVPFFKFPTATRGLGNGASEFGVTVPVQVSLPYGVTGLVVTEFSDLKNENDTGRHAGFSGIVNLSRSIAPKLTASVEYASFVQATHLPTQHTLDLSLAYLIAPNTQIDTATYIGLNKAAPDLVAYVGLSQRF